MKHLFTYSNISGNLGFLFSLSLSFSGGSLFGASYLSASIWTSFWACFSVISLDFPLPPPWKFLCLSPVWISCLLNPVSSHLWLNFSFWWSTSNISWKMMHERKIFWGFTCLKIPLFPFYSWLVIWVIQPRLNIVFP